MTTDKMSLESIEKAIGSRYADLGRHLRDEGMTKGMIIGWLSVEHQTDPKDPSLDVMQMNIIGSLRANGYIVSGGRRGGKLYKIQGWKEKEEKIPVEDWEGESRQAYDWVQNLPPLTERSWDTVRAWLGTRDPKRLHENSWVYIWAYEGARNEKWFWSSKGSALIIFQKFVNRPRFRIFNLNAEPVVALAIASLLSKASCARVPIINIEDRFESEFRQLHPDGEVLKRTEAIYDTQHISKHPEEYWSKKSWKTVRSRINDTSFVVDQPPEDREYVIQTWKDLNEIRHRQLAITRDFIAAALTDYPLSTSYGAVRDGHPVGHVLVDPVVGFGDTVMLSNEKGLNYRTFPDGREVPGGRSGTSDFMQYHVCDHLADSGIGYIQSGDVDGGGIGLRPKKMKFACDVTHSRTFVTKFTLSEYA